MRFESIAKVNMAPWNVLQTLRLRECMLAHRDYYAPLLEEEEAELEAARQAQLEEEGIKEGDSV